MSKIIINKEVLSKVLSNLSTGFPSKELIGTDGLFKFDFKKDHATIYVINSRVAMSHYIKCEADEEVIFCIHNRIIREMVRNFPEGEIVLTTEGSPVKTINLKPEGTRKKYKIACSTDDMPNMPEEPEFGTEYELPAGSFAKTMKDMADNADSGNTVPSLANVNACSFDGKMTFVSGNQFLLFFQKTNIELTSQFIIPTTAVKYIGFFSGVEPCRVTIGENTMFISYSGFNMSLSLVDGKISNYKALLDTEEPNGAIVFNKKELLECVNRLAIFSDETERIIMRIKDKECDMVAYNIEFGNEGSEVIPCGTDEGFELEVALKHSVIRKVCGNIQTDNVIIKRKGNIVFFKPEDNNDTVWLGAPSNL